MEEERLSFEYWSDPLCIWAYVAQDKLDRILEEFGDSLRVDYRIVPVFGSVPWRFESGPWSKHGAKGRCQATRRVAQEHGHDEVTGTCWLDDCPASSWAPAMALEAVGSMEEAEIVPSGTFARYQKSLRRHFFVDGKNVARRSVQLALAESLEIPRGPLEERLDDGTALARLWEDLHDKERVHVQGSPTYVFDGGRAMLYGNFPFGILHATVEELVRGLRPGASQC